MPGNDDQGTIFRYLRQGRQGRITVQLERLMSQMIDAERRRNSMTPHIPVPVQRLRATIRRYNVRYGDIWSNSPEYSTPSTEEGGTGGIANDASRNSELTSYQAQSELSGQSTNSSQSDNEQSTYRLPIDDEDANSSFDDENDTNYNEADSSFSSIHSMRQMSDYVFPVVEDDRPASIDTARNGNVGTVEEISSSEEDGAPNYNGAATFSNSSNNTFPVLGGQNATGNDTATNGNEGGVAGDDSTPSLTELLHIEVEDQLPHIFRGAPYQYDATRRGTRRPSLEDVPFLNTSPADIEMQAIQAIQRYENFVQCGLNSRDYSQNNGSLLLYTMRSVFPVFVLHPNLIIEFQTRALEYDATKALKALEELSPPRAVLPDDLSDNCIICLAEFELKQHVRVLVCNHKYHRTCIDTWCRTSLTCPVCRGTVDGKAGDNINQSYGDPLATLRGLEFVRAYLVRCRYSETDVERAGPSTSQD